MFNSKLLFRCVSWGLLCAILPAANAATSWHDARNDAMGSTGVASSSYLSASLVNPALLTKYKSNDHFGVLFPSIAAQTTPYKEILDDLDRITDSWQAIQDAKTIPEAYTKVNDLKDALHASSNLDDLNINADISMAIAVPNQTLPFALLFKNWAKVTGRAKVTQEDLDFIDQIVRDKLIPSTTKEAEKQMSSRVEVNHKYSYDI